MTKQMIEKTVVRSVERVFAIGGTELRIVEKDGRITELEATALGWQTYIPGEIAPILRDLLVAALE